MLVIIIPINNGFGFHEAQWTQFNLRQLRDSDTGVGAHPRCKWNSPENSVTRRRPKKASASYGPWLSSRGDSEMVS